MQEKARVWDLPVRIFHWSLAASFAAAYVLSESERQRGAHVLLGYTVMGLIAFRLVWGLVGSRYARFTSFLYGPGKALAYLRDALAGRPAHYVGHNPAGSWAVYALLLLGLATGVSGYLNLGGLGGEAMEELHEWLANAWLVVVLMHVGGVVLSSIAHRENLVRAMVTGYKRGQASESIAGTAPAVGLLVAASIMAFWAWGLFLSPPLSAAEAGGDQEHQRLVSDDESDHD